MAGIVANGIVQFLNTGRQILHPPHRKLIYYTISYPLSKTILDKPVLALLFCDKSSLQQAVKVNKTKNYKHHTGSNNSLKSF